MPLTLPDPVQTALKHPLTLAPKFVDLTRNLVYADIWERKELSKRDRSLITVAALVALYRPEQLRSHFHRALVNGVTKEELAGQQIGNRAEHQRFAHK